MIPNEVVTRFWERVERRGPDQCWPWLGSGTYGTIRIGKRTFLAHRLSWEIYHNRPMPRHLFACHKCDRYLCVNPLHIVAATAKDNARDAVAKNRPEIREELIRLYKRESGYYTNGWGDAHFERWLIDNPEAVHKIEAAGVAEFKGRPARNEALPMLRDGVMHYSVCAHDPVGVPENPNHCQWSVYRDRKYIQCRNTRLSAELCYVHYKIAVAEPHRPRCTFGPDFSSYDDFSLQNRVDVAVAG